MSSMWHKNLKSSHMRFDLKITLRTLLKTLMFVKFYCHLKTAVYLVLQLEPLQTGIWLLSSSAQLLTAHTLFLFFFFFLALWWHAFTLCLSLLLITALSAYQRYYSLQSDYWKVKTHTRPHVLFSLSVIDTLTSCQLYTQYTMLVFFPTHSHCLTYTHTHKLSQMG